MSQMSEVSITFTPSASALTFYGGDTKVWLTISSDGVMTVGPDLSEEEATQRVAKMLAERYSALHKQQAEEIARLSAELSDLRAAVASAMPGF